MNGNSSFQEIEVFYLPITLVSLLHKQRHQYGKGSRHLLRNHDLVALSADASTKPKTVPDTIFRTLYLPRSRP